MPETYPDVMPPANAAAQLIEMARGYQTTQLLYVAASLGLADFISTGAKTIDEIALATSTSGPALHRLLRALAGFGIVEERDDGRFGMTPMGELLQEGSMRAIILHFGGDMYRVWGELHHSIATGEPAFEKVFGMSNWERRRQDATVNAIFNANQAARTRLQGSFVADAYSFPDEGVIVDVGGGNGTLISIILGHHPGLTGVLFDQPHVAEQAHTVIDRAGVAARCRIAGGDFFAEVPTGGHVYILSNVLNDWDDADASRILTVCRRAMTLGARLVIIENVVEPDKTASLMADLHMLVTQGGRHRTESEFRAVLAVSGFQLTSLVPLPTQSSIIEAMPA
jgi:hypothetical protein